MFLECSLNVPRMFPDCGVCGADVVGLVEAEPRVSKVQMQMGLLKVP
jgi:hypothetical protein